MTQTLVWAYDDLESAERCRDALVQEGFAGTRIEVTASDDEAGPVEGNFIAGSGRDDRGVSRYASNFGTVVQRGSIVLTVALEDEAQRDHACAIARRFGGIDVQERAGRAAR